MKMDWWWVAGSLPKWPGLTARMFNPPVYIDRDNENIEYVQCTVQGNGNLRSYWLLLRCGCYF